MPATRSLVDSGQGAADGAAWLLAGRGRRQLDAPASGSGIAWPNWRPNHPISRSVARPAATMQTATAFWIFGWMDGLLDGFSRQRAHRRQRLVTDFAARSRQRGLPRPGRSGRARPDPGAASRDVPDARAVAGDCLTARDRAGDRRSSAHVAGDLVRLAGAVPATPAPAVRIDTAL